MEQITLSDKLKPTEKIAKIKITTEAILSLPESFFFPNGWSQRQLLIHLWSWDDQFLELCHTTKKSARKKFVYAHDGEKLPYEKWNDVIIEKFDDMSYEEAREIFEETRIDLIKSFEKFAKLIMKEGNEGKYDYIEKLMDLWVHDKLHLESGGIAPYL